MSRVLDPSSNSTDLLSHSSKFGTASEACVFNLLPKDACKYGIATELCIGCCYTFKMVADRPKSYRFIEKNFALSKRGDFAPRMIYHIRQANVPDFRIHSSGDFYSEDYLHAWIRIVEACEEVKFTAYTRAWRINERIPGLTQIASLPNMNLWLSEDAETGRSPAIPKTRVAWLADNDGRTPPDHAKLVFRATVERLTELYIDEGKLKAKRRFTLLKVMGKNVTVCPHENGLPGMPATCVECRICMWRTK